MVPQYALDGIVSAIGQTPTIIAHLQIGQQAARIASVLSKLQEQQKIVRTFTGGGFN